MDTDLQMSSELLPPFLTGLSLFPTISLASNLPVCSIIKEGCLEREVCTGNGEESRTVGPTPSYSSSPQEKLG